MAKLIFSTQEANLPQKAFVFFVFDIFLIQMRISNLYSLFSNLYSLFSNLYSLFSILYSQPLRNHRTILGVVACAEVFDAFNGAHALKFAPVIAKIVADIHI